MLKCPTTLHCISVPPLSPQPTKHIIPMFFTLCPDVIKIECVSLCIQIGIKIH